MDFHRFGANQRCSELGQGFLFPCPLSVRCNFHSVDSSCYVARCICWHLVLHSAAMGQTVRSNGKSVTVNATEPFLKLHFLFSGLGLVCGNHAMLLLVGRVLWQSDYVLIVQQIRSQCVSRCDDRHHFGHIYVAVGGRHDFRHSGSFSTRNRNR